MSDLPPPTPPKVERVPGTAAAEHGHVFLDGPDGVAVAMTPDCARETAHRMIAAADEAAAQTRD